MIARVTVGKAGDHDQGDTGAGNNPQLPGLRNGSCQSPIRDGHTHAALDDLRKLHVSLPPDPIVGRLELG